MDRKITSLRVCAAGALGMLLCAAAPVGLGAQAAKSGEQVYKETCSVCHATGVANAPKFGDKAAWGPLIKEGQHVLTAHGWVGVRGMPPKGGKADLPLDEFARGVAFMARAGGGDWKDPDAAMLDRIRAEEKKRVEELKKKK
jgi:cytochrome c5